MASYRSGEIICIGDIWKCRLADNPDDDDCIYLNEELLPSGNIKVVYSYNNGLTWQGNITIRQDELADYFFVRKNKKVVEKSGFARFVTCH